MRLADRRITLDVTPAARGWLAATGYDPAYGARPLRRLVQKEIGDRLARALLGGEVLDGQNVVIDVERGEALKMPEGVEAPAGMEAPVTGLKVVPGAVS